MNNVQLFSNPKFGDIRIVEIEGKPYFVGNDVANALGYSSPKDAISRHCKGATFHRLSDNQGIMRETKVIPQGDIYRLAAKSELPGAEEFESWIFDDVLVSIANYGAYMAPQTIDSIIADPANGIKLLKALQEEREAKDRITAEKEEVETKLVQLKPTIEYAERVLNDKKNTLLTNQIAKEFGMSDQVLNAILRDLGIQYKQNGQWLLTHKYADKGYTDTRTSSGESPESSWTSVSTVWFQSGRRFIHGLIDPLLESKQLEYTKGRWHLYNKVVEIKRSSKKSA